MSGFVWKTRRSIFKRTRWWFDSYTRLRWRFPVRMPQGDGRAISVAITTYNNIAMAHVSLFHILSDRRIAEIVVLDDCSDADQFEMLVEKLRPFREKVKLFRREVNLGMLPNKIQAVGLCESERVILLDYDNTLLPACIDAYFAIDQWEPDTIYCPGEAYPHIDLRNELGDATIDFDWACDRARQGRFPNPFFDLGNYLVPRDAYTQYIQPHWEFVPSAADCHFVNYTWLGTGHKLHIVKDARYIHRVHGGSYWLNNQHLASRTVGPVMQRFRDGQRPDVESMRNDFEYRPGEWVEPVRVPLD